MKFYAPMPRAVHGEGQSDLIRRLFRSIALSGTQRIDLITTTRLRVAVVESPGATIAEGDTVVHVLWQADESHASITIGGESFSIAPGDTAAIPAGDEWLLSPEQLAIVVVRRTQELILPTPPHHGIESFVSYNRATAYNLPENQTITRWKLTEPLTLPASDQDVIAISLYNTIALQHRSEVNLMHQGDVRVIRAGEGAVTLVPNGLTYVLLVRA
ncbi:MAG: hypothetical protein KC435_03165 [Thermomicrobiales bacterium]|nr:hypothetical protein [Thermomicrobiales bacterium]